MDKAWWLVGWIVRTLLNIIGLRVLRSMITHRLGKVSYLQRWNKGETQLLWLTRQRICKNGQRDDISGDGEVERRMPNTTQLILTFYLEFAPIKILKSENL